MFNNEAKWQIKSSEGFYLERIISVCHFLYLERTLKAVFAEFQLQNGLISDDYNINCEFFQSNSWYFVLFLLVKFVLV